MMENKSTFKSEEIRELSSYFDIGEVSSCKEIVHNRISRTKKVLLATFEGRYIAKFYEKSTPSYLGFLKWAYDEGLPCQRVVGNSPHVFQFSSNPVILYSFLEGEIKDKMSQEELSNLGKVIAKLHNLSEKYLHRKPSLGEGLTHGDLGTPNIVFSGKKPSLIDFDWIDIRPYLKDVASFIFFYQLKQFQNQNKKGTLEEFINSYMSCRKLALDKSYLESEIVRRAEWFERFSRQEYSEGKIDKKRLVNRCNFLSGMDGRYLK